MTLEHTSERMVEEFYQSNAEDYLIYLMHVATYRFAAQFTRGKKVLDFGCGSGYGTALVADEAAWVCGVDLAADAVAYAAQHYQKPNLSFQPIGNIEIAPLPFEDGAFEVVLSFQVIEHIRPVEKYLAEIRRVVAPGGLALIATPNRTYRLLPFQKPWNVWHVREYSEVQLAALLRRYFDLVRIYSMGGSDAVMSIERRRAARVKWAALAFTLPFTPEGVRQGGLKLLKRLKAAGQKPGAPAGFKPPFGEQDITVGEHGPGAINLIAAGRKPA